MGLLNVIRKLRIRQVLPIREIACGTGFSRNNSIKQYLNADTIERQLATPERLSKLDPFAKKLSGVMSCRPSRPSPMTHTSACSPLAPSRPRPSGSGPPHVTEAPVAGTRFQPPGIGSSVIAKASTPLTISPATAAVCRPMAMPGSRTSIDPVPSAMVARVAHVRRMLVDIYRSPSSPFAEEAIGQIAQL
jgi:hypothetical protein